ncbi:MAG: DNA ligase [Proteobacteria bacterium]|nr:DNA ligase [Pseudomonadota bacterium]
MNLIQRKKFLFLLFFSPIIFSVPLSLQAGSNESKNGERAAPVALAHSWEESTDVKGWWMSEKLDGVRGYWTGKEMVSRSGKPFNIPQWFIRNFPPTALDGELWLGRQQFSGLVSIVRRKEPHDDWKKVRYFIFDAPGIEGSFEKRIGSTQRWFARYPSAYAEVLKQEVCEGKVHLKAKLKEVESLGGEGLMLRRPESLYLVGRTHDLLKVKTYRDTEAVVVNHTPGSGRNEGRLGSLLVRLPNGIEFSIGGGFSDDDRKNPPPIGSTITFKYYSLTKKGVPRFASFLRIREN